MKPMIHSKASISNDAKIGENVTIGPGVCIERWSKNWGWM